MTIKGSITPIFYFSFYLLFKRSPDTQRKNYDLLSFALSRITLSFRFLPGQKNTDLKFELYG